MIIKFNYKINIQKGSLFESDTVPATVIVECKVLYAIFTI
mgnify:FL=1|jgi:hypothetical protein